MQDLPALTDRRQWPYLWLDATYEKARRDHHIVSVAVIVAMAVNTDGRRNAAAARAHLQRRLCLLKAAFHAGQDFNRPDLPSLAGLCDRPTKVHVEAGRFVDVLLRKAGVRLGHTGSGHRAGEVK